MVKKFSAFYGTRRLISVFTKAHHWSWSKARWIHFTSSHLISPRSILILTSLLCLGLTNNLFFPSGFPTRILYAFLIPHMCATCHIHLIFLDLITRIIFKEVYKLWSSSLCSFLQSSAICSVLGPNVLSILLSNTLYLCYSLSVRE